MQIKVLSERYADTLSVGLLIWLRADVQMAHPQLANVIAAVL